MVAGGSAVNFGQRSHIYAAKSAGRAGQPLASPAPTGLHDGQVRNGRIMLELIVYLLQFVGYLINLYTYIVIAVVIVSWLMAFGVINAYNPMVRSIWQALNAVTEPLLAPIRNAMPNLGGIDISPVILLLACYFFQGLIQNVVIPKLALAFS